MQFFDNELIDHVWNNILEACSGGHPITLKNLVEKCGFTEKNDEVIVRELVAREFKATGKVEIVLGPGGGIFLAGVEKVKNTAGNPDAYDLDDEYLERVRTEVKNLLNLKPSGIKTAFLTGRLNEIDEKKVLVAVAKLDEFEVAKGAGIRRKQSLNPAAQ